MPLSFEEESLPALILDLGHLSLRSDLSADKRRRKRERERNLERDKSIDEKSVTMLETIEEDFYSKFLLSMTSLQAFISTHALSVSEMGIGEEGVDATKRQQIIEKFDLHFILHINKFKSTSLTSTK